MRCDTRSASRSRQPKFRPARPTSVRQQPPYRGPCHLYRQCAGAIAVLAESRGLELDTVYMRRTRVECGCEYGLYPGDVVQHDHDRLLRVEELRGQSVAVVRDAHLNEIGLHILLVDARREAAARSHGAPR